MANLCIGFYVGKAHASNVHELLDIAGCWAHGEGEINAWIAKDKDFEADGLSDNLKNVVRMKQCTATAAVYLDIKDMGNIATFIADDLELEDAGSDSDIDSD
jgi:hypothetical protein